MGKISNSFYNPQFHIGLGGNLIIIRIFYGLLLLPLCFLYSQGGTYSKPSICLIINEHFRGEREFAERMRIACERLSWKVAIYDPDSFKKADSHFDWIFTLVPDKEFSLKYDDYLILFDPVHHYFNQDGHLNEKYRGYTGYLTTYGNSELLLEDIKYKKKQFYPKRWYPTAHYRPYRKVTPTRLFYFIGHWGDRYYNHRYQTLQNELAQTNYANLFGNPSTGVSYGKAFKGDIKYDGESVINLISEMGVCLVFHSKTHIQHEIPSGRIFEAAAASAVIISDLNPFIIKHFGDAVFYVDQELSGEEMFKQIDTYMAWIQNHSEEALKMAQRAHQIFEEKFLLENQLLDFNNFRESLQFVDNN
ncbi:MAG: hypothetical protein CK425_09690 [Parachlamydia sp.]|nr:MAG: hypothetical protein CK425_09690 [Parachlamydia sp.]